MNKSLQNMFYANCRFLAEPSGRDLGIHVTRAGIVEVRIDIMLQQIRPRLPLQSIPEQIHRPAIQSFLCRSMTASMSLRGNIGQSTQLGFGLGEITGPVQVVIDQVNHCSDFRSSSVIKPRLTSSSYARRNSITAFR